MKSYTLSDPSALPEISEMLTTWVLIAYGVACSCGGDANGMNRVADPSHRRSRFGVFYDVIRALSRSVRMFDHTLEETNEKIMSLVLRRSMCLCFPRVC